MSGLRDYRCSVFLVSGLILLTSCATDSFNHPLVSEGQTHETTVDPLTTRPLQAALFDSLAPIYPDTEVVSGVRIIETDMPRDAADGVVLMVRPTSAEEAFSVELAGDIAGEVEFYELISIPVLQNTGYFGMTERQMGFPNRHVIRDAPFSVYEVLRPSSPGLFSGEGVYAFHLKYRASSDAEVGIREVVIKAGGEVLRWRVRIHPITPDTGPGAELYYTNWFRGPQQGFEKIFDEDWWRIMEKHLAFMREGGQNVVLVPQHVAFRNVGDTWMLAPERLERFLSLCERMDFLLFEGPRPGFRKSSHLKRGVVVGPGRLETFTDEASEWIDDAYAPLYEFLDARGSLDTWVQHILDEPYGRHAEDYRWISDEMRKAMPGVRIIDATKTRSSLKGAVDIWCPLVNSYSRNAAFFDRRHEEGDEIWFYSCMVPGGAWLNRTMDQERLRSVYVGWGAALYGVTGYLRWDLDRWRDNQDIWQGELSGSDDAWVRRPFGDGFVVYPDGDGGFLSTTRWEAGRLGCEDYRLLMMLKDGNPDRFEEVAAMCFSDLKTYKTEPDEYRAAKKALLEALCGY